MAHLTKVLTLALVLAGCSSPTETGTLTPIGGPLYDGWFMETAACLGQEGRSPGEVDIFSTPTLTVRGQPMRGVFLRPRTIILAEHRATSRITFTHEVVHYLAAPTNEARWVPESFWVRCTGEAANHS